MYGLAEYRFTCVEEREGEYVARTLDLDGLPCYTEHDRRIQRRTDKGEEPQELETEGCSGWKCLK